MAASRRQLPEPPPDIGGWLDWFRRVFAARAGSGVHYPSSRTKDGTGYDFPFNSDTMLWLWRVISPRFTPAGGWLIAMTLLAAGAGSNSLDVQLFVVFVYILGIWVVAVAMALLLRPNVEIRAWHVDRVKAGEALVVEVEVRQRRRFLTSPITIIPWGLPRRLHAGPEVGVALPPIRPGGSVRAELRLQCSRRGLYSWRGFRAETDFPLGLIRSTRSLDMGQKLLVLPRFTPLTHFAIPVGVHYQPGGVLLASQVGEAFEYIGNRPYRQGDSVRRIDWRATARLGDAIVREYREEYFLRVGVVMDTHVPANSGDEAAANFERAVSTCAAVSEYMARSDYIVDIFAAGPRLYHLTAGRSLAYLDQILEILACVESGPDEPFEKIEPELIAYLVRITTVVCVFVDWNEARREFVERLRREGAGVKVIILRDTPCTVPPEAGPDRLPVITAAQFESGVRDL